MIELTTQCPQCQHRFDVTLVQLQQRKGLLRCDQCAHIFDAYAGAVAEPDSPPMVSELSSKRSPSNIEAKETIPEPLVISTRARPSSKNIITSSQPIQSTAEIETEPYNDIRVYLHTEDVSKLSGPLEPVIPPIESQSVSSEHDDFTFTPEPARFSPRSLTFESEEADDEIDSPWNRWLWGTVFWLLLLVLAGQLIYVYRSHIANSVAFTRPVLQWMCDEIGCDLPYMREINAIEIRQSALQQQPSFGKEQRYAYQLQLQLKNNLAWAQEWPTLVVSFSDASAAVMATMAISPEQYLSPSQLSRPFEAGAQQAIRVPVTVENKKINGFTIDKYYP